MWFLRNNKKYQKHKELILAAFPAMCTSDVEKVIEVLTFDKDYLTSDQFGIVNLNNETIRLPYRIYFEEPDKKAILSLNKKQQIILNCLLTRHHDGFIRQRNLESITAEVDEFIITFVIQLLGEYVIEILPVAQRNINSLTMPAYRKFISDNAIFFQKTESRMISYWNEYYRWKYPKRKEYIGQQIFDYLKRS